MAGPDYQEIKRKCYGNWPEIMVAIVPSIQPAIDAAPRQREVDDPVSGSKKCFRFFKDFRETGGSVVNINGGICHSSGFETLQYLLQADFTTVYNKVREYFGESPVQTEPGTSAQKRQFVAPSGEAPTPGEAPPSYRDAPSHVDPHAPLAKQFGVKQAPDPTWVKDLLNRVWQESIPHQNPKAELLRFYMDSRCLELPKDCMDVRFHPGLPCMELNDKKGKYEEVFTFPAMISMVRDPDGQPVTLHRTWLAEDGSGKAKVPEGFSNKMVMPVLDGQSLSGASVRLFTPGKVIGVAEGIETALAAHFLHKGMPVWAGLSAAYIKSFIPPEGVEKLILFADLDHPIEGDQEWAGIGTGIKFMAMAAQQAAMAGIRVSIQPALAFGDRQKVDYADIWLEVASRPASRAATA